MTSGILATREALCSTVIQEMEAALGVEPRMRVLQTLALPFGDAALKSTKKKIAGS
jgi:hypothetical protein